MRVGVHLEALRPGEIGGLEDYVRRLLETIPALDPEIELVSDTFVPKRAFRSRDARTLGVAVSGIWLEGE